MTELPNTIGPVDQGRTEIVFNDTLSSPSTLSSLVFITSDSILVSLWVESLSNATLTVTASTITETGKEFPIIAFPVVAGPTQQLLLRKASLAMSKVILRAELTGAGAATFQVHLRGINIGETTTKIAGSANATATPYLAGPTASILVPAALQDRAAVQVYNNGPAGTLYIGFTPGEATPGNGYPVGLGGYWAGDLAAGAAIYASTSGPVIDVRTIQAFG